MRSVAITVVLAVVACSSQTGTSTFDGDAAVGVRGWPEGCEPEPVHLDAVPMADCAPCLGRDFREGLDCSDLVPDFECEVGDHPANECNDVWRCDDNLEWHQIHARRATEECSRDLVQGGSCEQSNLGLCLRVPEEQACLIQSPLFAFSKEVYWKKGYDFHGIILEHRPRLGCPCADRWVACSTGSRCVDGHYRIGEDPTCPIPL
ncbi:hypothetical protein BH09MYX1_BH09MYX1_29760 [soil metagenome]